MHRQCQIYWVVNHCSGYNALWTMGLSMSVIASAAMLCMLHSKTWSMSQQDIVTQVSQTPHTPCYSGPPIRHFLGAITQASSTT